MMLKRSLINFTKYVAQSGPDEVRLLIFVTVFQCAFHRTSLKIHLVCVRLRYFIVLNLYLRLSSSLIKLRLVCCTDLRKYTVYSSTEALYELADLWFSHLP